MSRKMWIPSKNTPIQVGARFSHHSNWTSKKNRVSQNVETSQSVCPVALLDTRFGEEKGAKFQQCRLIWNQQENKKIGTVHLADITEQVFQS